MHGEDPLETFRSIGRMITNPFACPQCRGELCRGQTEEALICAPCRANFPIRYNIPCFTEGSSRWRLSSGVSSEEVLALAREKGWRQSLSIMEKSRADWVRGEDRFTLSLLSSPKNRILDCGSGWGALSFWLAKEFEQVFALDSQLDGLRFTDIRAEQEGIRHLTTVQGSVLSLPFDSDFFDVVVLNGVLEWVGTFSEHKPPQVLQESALREIERVLKPEGTLFLAIENRYGLQYFLGYKEEHTGLRFISLLPRFLANLYHRVRRGGALRVLTHSRSALTRMLGRSGFKGTRWFFTHPSYRNCRYAASLAGLEAFQFIVGQLLQKPPLSSLLRAASRINPLMKLSTFFSPSWIVFASSSSIPRLGLQSPNGLVELTSSPGIAITINARRVNVFSLGGNPTVLVGKYSVPLNERALRKARMSYACVQFIARTQPQLKDHLPDVTLRDGRLGLIDYTAATRGAPLQLGQQQSLESLVEILLELCKLSVPPHELNGVFADCDIRQTLRRIALQQGLVDQLGEILYRAQVLHGDLNLGNILCDPQNPHQLTLVDFEHARIGPAVLNWYDFILRNLLIAGDALPLSAKTVIRRLQRLPGNRNADPAMNRLTADYLDGCRLSRDLHHPLLTLYLRHLCSDPIIDEPNRVLDALRQQKLSLAS